MLVRSFMVVACYTFHATASSNHFTVDLSIVAVVNKLYIFDVVVVVVVVITLFVTAFVIVVFLPFWRCYCFSCCIFLRFF